jgi:hypothetical protein
MDTRPVRIVEPACWRSRLGWGPFVGAVGVMLIVWLVLLPALSDRPAFQACVARLNAQGIDPSAIFYTEQAVSLDVLATLTRRTKRQKTSTGSGKSF